MASKQHAKTSPIRSQEIDTRGTPLGPVRYVRFYRDDDKPVGWRELWEAFAERYPDQWAIQLFPPANELINEANVYHLWVLDDVPENLNIARKARPQEHD